MERRIGTAIVLVKSKESVDKLNAVLSNHGDIIIGRQGIPLRERQINIISLVVFGSTDEIGSLTGKIGNLRGIEVKSVLTKFTKEDEQ
jgi:putative iron-only hydrogenase system regulator